MFAKLRYYIRHLLRPASADAEFSEELAFHVAEHAARLERDGIDPVEAQRRARVALGGMERTREEHRDGRGRRWIDTTLADVRHGARVLRRNPSLTLTATATLAIAIGANTAIFSAVNAVLLDPLPFAKPSQLVMIGESNPDFNWQMGEAAPANFLDWRTRNKSFQDILGYASFMSAHTMVTAGEPQVIHTAQVTGNFFSSLGVPVQLGRGFVFDDTWQNGEARVILSDRVWRERFGARADVIDQLASIDGIPTRIVGVAPRGFAFPFANVDVWQPFAFARDAATQTWFRRAHWLRVIGRLKPGVTPQQGDAEIHTIAAQLKTEYPATNRVMGADVVPLQRFLVGDTRLPLLILLGSVTLLLLIACANVGNLLLIQAAAREREVAVRAALGAGRKRIIRQALTESLMLAACGGIAGLVLGWGGTRLLASLQPAGMLRTPQISVDWKVAVYVMIVTTVAGLVFGIAPALWTSGRAPHDALAAGARGGVGRRAHRWAGRLAAAEVAIALLLTIGAGLLVRSFALLVNVNPGFDAEHVIAANVQLPSSRYDTPDKLNRFFEELIERAHALPGVTSAASITHVPLTAPGWSSDFSIEGASGGHFGASLVHRQISGDYFGTMHVPVLKGRGFAPADADGPAVVVINEAFAREYFKGADPIGQRIAYDREPSATSTWRTIVGVVGSERQGSPAAPSQIEVIGPSRQERASEMALVARTTGDPAALAPAIRKLVTELDPQLAVEWIRPMTEIKAAAVARDRFITVLLGMFGTVGLALAVVGVYGVVTQLARSRQREMAIRLALGAPGHTVRGLILRRGMSLAVIGAVAGAIAALVLSRSLGSLLYGIAPTDLMTFVVATAAVVLASLVASAIPAIRAARVDPGMTLRE